MTEPNTKYSEGLTRAEAFFNQVFPSLEFKSNVEKHSEAQGEETNAQKKPGKEKCGKCNYVSTNKNHLKVHVESVHDQILLQ